MSQLVKSEFVTLLSANEASFGAQAVIGWSQNQPNPGGIQNYYPQYKKTRRSPLSINLQNEKGDIVGLAVAPSIVHDANKDLFDLFGEQIMRSATKFPGGTGVGRWQVANGAGGVSAPTIALTGVTATGYTVASGGAVIQNLLVNAVGFTNAANNGLKVVGAGSINTEVKTAGLVVEASPPVGARLEVVGIQGTAGDFTITAGLNLGATALNWTTVGLNVGQWIWIGGGTAAAPGALGFATAADRGFARITAIAAGQLTIDRKTQVYTADTGVAKTIQVFFGPWLRNVNGLHADYKELSKSLEVSWPGAAAAGATSYQYGIGCCLDKFEFAAGSEDLTECTLSFVGQTMTDPTVTRATQAVNAMPPVAIAGVNTVSEEKRLRVVNVDESGVSVDIMNWKLTVENNVKAQTQQGTLGAARMIFGKFEVNLDLTAVFIQDDVCKAVSDNRTCMFEAAFRNNDFGILFDIPSLTLSSGNPSIPANDAVTLGTTEEAFRDSVYNYTLGISLFPSLPAN